MLADRAEFGGQAPEALEVVDLGLDGVDALGGHGAGGALAVDVTHQHRVGTVAGIVLVMAAAGRRAALHEAMDEGAGAHVAEGGECGEDAVAPLLESGDVGGSWGSGHDPSLLYRYQLKQGSGTAKPNQRDPIPISRNPVYLKIMSYTRSSALSANRRNTETTLSNSSSIALRNCFSPLSSNEP